jgi:alkylation response protein AidB-like acyl-CoA dehydrogenase
MNLNLDIAVKKGIKQPKPLPAPNSDFYGLVETLPAEEVAVVKQVRAFMETKVAPIITKYWVEDAFPFELLPAIKELGIGGVGMNGYGCRGGSAQLFGLVAMEMAKFDCSIATFFGVHSGLAMGSIYLGGSEEQKQKWLPPMARWEKIGCFGLTEPLVGSGTSGGLTTTAKRDGDTWVLNGQKKWIGNSPWCDISIIWARDLADNQVKAFIVENKTTPGFKVEKIQNKIALKVVQNGLITMENCRVPEENRLQADQSFRDTAKVLKMTRFMVGWEATGCAMGAYENRAQVLPGASAVRQADCLIPDGAGSPRKDARQHHRFTVPPGAHVATTGRRQDDRRACIARQGLHYRQVPRNRGLGPRVVRRQRDRRRVQRGTFLCGC